MERLYRWMALGTDSIVRGTDKERNIVDAFVLMKVLGHPLFG